MEAITAMAVRMPNGDGPVPDLLITTGDVDACEKGMPAATVHTVIEVVSPTSQKNDRLVKAALYADGGVPCCWRVELRSWRGHFGPLPAVVVRLFDGDKVEERLYAAGEAHEIPLVIGPDVELMAVRLDPAVLVGPRR